MTTINEGVREYSIITGTGKPINGINLPQEQFADEITINGQTYHKQPEEPKSTAWKICSNDQFGKALTWQKWAAPLTGTRQEAVHHFYNVYQDRTIHNVLPCRRDYKGTSCFTSSIPYEAK